MNMLIHSNIRNYEVLFEQSNTFIDSIQEHPQACYIVDENVWRIYSSTLLNQLPGDHVIIVPINENRKNLDTVQELYSRLLEYPAKRNLTMITIGGGILQDISGFTASTMYRGISWIYIPTTLLAQADSCIGSKTSLNFQSYKNLIGTFYPPTRIHVYTPFLQTLEKSDFYSGFGEVIKLHLMGGMSSYKLIVELTPDILNRETDALFKAIKQSLKIKLEYMEGDEFDQGRRNLLNYGHDFGHAIESTSNFLVPHGQGVIFGMIASNIVARKRGLLDSNLENEISEKVLIPNLIIKPPIKALEPNIMFEAMKKDKKRVGDKLALIMMDNNFTLSRVNDLTVDEVTLTLGELKSRLGY